MTYDATHDSIHSTYVLPFTITALAVIGYGLVAMILFWRNRTIQPIKSRSPGFVIFSQFVMLLWVVQLIIQRTLPNSIPCWINTLLNHLILGVIIDCYLIRLFTLHFAYAVMKEMMESERGRQGRSEIKRATVPLSITTTAPSSPNTSHNADSAPSPSPSPSSHAHTNTNPYYSYTANKHWIAPRTLAMMMCCAIIIQMIPSSIYVATRKTTWNTMTGDIACTDTTNNIILLCMMLCYCSIFIYGAYRLRTVVDAFVIKKELAISGYCVLITAVLWFAIGQIIPDLTSEVHITTYLLITNVTAILTVSLIMPWYKTYLHTSITSQQMEMSQCTSTSKPVKHLTLFPIKKDEPARLGTKSSVSSTEIRSNPSPALSQRPMSSPPSSFSVSVPIQQRVLTTRNSSLSSPILMASTSLSNDISSFSKLLRHDAGIEAFRSFLCLEFSVENLLMWEECGLFVQCGRTKLSLLTSSRTITEEEEPPMDMSPLLKLMTDVAIVVPPMNLDGDVNDTPSHDLHGISIQVDATTPTTAARRVSTSITSATPKRMSIFPQGYRQNLFSEYGTEVHEQPIPSHVDVDPSTHPSTITNNMTSTTSHEDEHQKQRHSSISLVGEIHKDTNQNGKNEMLAFDIHAGALRIFNKYIRRGSPYEVNLSHQVIEMVSSRLQISSPHGEMASPLAVQEQTVIVDAIQSAQDTIYRLMKTDSYLRFMASKQYHDLIRNLTLPISS